MFNSILLHVWLLSEYELQDQYGAYKTSISQ